MYTEVGAFNAKAHLSQLLKGVESGQCYTITLRGRPLADLIPSESVVRQNAFSAVEKMRSIRQISGVSDQTLAEWIAEGRR